MQYLLFAFNLVGISFVLFIGTLLLISVASLFAITILFLFASLVQLVSTIYVYMKSQLRKSSGQKRESYFIEESDFWKQESRQNLASLAIHEIDERQAS